jgi:hypothetical protein
MINSRYTPNAMWLENPALIIKSANGKYAMTTNTSTNRIAKNTGVLRG